MSFKFSQLNFYFLMPLSLSLVAGFVMPAISTKDINNYYNMAVEPKTVRYLEYKVLSPDGTKEISVYAINDDPNTFMDNALAKQVFTLKNLADSSKKDILTSEKVDFPKWLGNNHIFFTTYCGSGCQGFDLVNISTKKRKNGVLSYMVTSDGKSEYTILESWSGKEIKFDGVPKEIISEIFGGKIWLVFNMIDQQGKALGQKRILFDETSL